MTVDNEEKAQRLVKKLFSKALIAQAEVTDGGFEREYIMMGSIHTDKSKVELELTTSDARVTELVDFINKNYHPGYDYPVDDITVEPITVANSSFINWVKGQTKKGKGFKYDEDEDKGNDDSENPNYY